MSAVFSRLNDIAFRLSMVSLGLVGIFLIVLVKSRAHITYDVGTPLYIYTIAITSFQLSRLVGAILYSRTKKTISSPAAGIPDFEPTVTFVIPCKNEESAIAKTINKCFSADYPVAKIEVIVVNDGSTDGTIQVLRRLQASYPRLVVVDWQTNRGKRHAMAEGFRQATGEIVIQLDSDSYISPDSFRHLIRPFADSRIGAVCAHADPENADTNWLTRMQAAYYFMSFRILKAAESAFTTVFCCSGCSSAYRRSVISPIVDRWLGEKFLGLPVTWGDDRALTNWVIRRGFKTVYTDDVQAFTICPDTFRQFLKQQIRWKKGWFVNSFFAARFILRREPFVALTYFFPLIIITLITPFIATMALVYNPLVRGIPPWYYLAGVFLVAAVMTTYYRYVARRNRYWPYMFVWSAINLVFLSFTLFYALATIQNRKWGTR